MPVHMYVFANENQCHQNNKSHLSKSGTKLYCSPSFDGCFKKKKKPLMRGSRNIASIIAELSGIKNFP